MDRLTRVPELRANPAALLAASWHAAGGGRGLRDMVVLPYRDRLEVFSRYLQQLVMESLGKKLNREGAIVHQGLAVYGNKGSTDQHAYVQQLRDGLDNFFVVFIEGLDDPDGIKALNKEYPGDVLEGFLQGTRSALSDGGRQSLTITLECFNARSLGALIALFERAVGLYGELININAYHQPGVEAGKKAAASVLEIQRQAVAHLAANPEKAYSADALATAVGQPDAAEMVFKICTHLAANQRRVQNASGTGLKATFQAL
jgi:glucose-6-phosphate isomerase